MWAKMIFTKDISKKHDLPRNVYICRDMDKKRCFHNDVKKRRFRRYVDIYDIYMGKKTFLKMNSKNVLFLLNDDIYVNIQN